jgi:hypothetical protein
MRSMIFINGNSLNCPPSDALVDRQIGRLPTYLVAATPPSTFSAGP